ncbi:hypothetical protein [Azospirillum sp. TSA6c]|uniref:hypothetical protein n=1 Tax=unclassified Azospirillum TaxID=2630922 RepID=UPI000D615E50|nr:hypothetical protein [Azospirillum sp. TSA6c]PWC48880.1 hypothetical protein TSA6c_21560 [Azospirillum sp. TSA6c]
MTHVFRVILAAAALWAAAAPSFSQELNQRQGLDPRTQAKINRTMAETMRQNSPNVPQPLTKPAQCGVNIGNVVTQGGAAPREVTTVIKGDAISVCK